MVVATAMAEARDMADTADTANTANMVDTVTVTVMTRITVDMASEDTFTAELFTDLHLTTLRHRKIWKR
ncbi:unnamed protein product [Ixodes pacificus]